MPASWSAPTWSCPRCSSRASTWPGSSPSSGRRWPAGCRPSGTTCCGWRPTRTSTSPRSRQVTAGGAAVPRALIEAFEDRVGVPITQGWGMTETSPLAALALPPAGCPPDEEMDYRVKAGRIVPGVEVRVVAEDGADPAQRRRVGGGVRDPRPVGHRLLLQGPDPDRFHDGWLRTGDVGHPRPPGLHADHRPHQGRHQVGRGVDLLGGAGERGDGPPRRLRGGGGGGARRPLAGAAAGLRGAGPGRARRPPTSWSSSSRAGWPGGGCPSAGPSWRRSPRPRSASSTRSWPCGPLHAEGKLDVVTVAVPPGG